MPARDLAWRIEETCWNAFPSLKQVLAGDFLLRFARGVSRRANSANPLRAEPGDIARAIGVAERLYRAQTQATIFRVPSIMNPALDGELASRGYTAEGETCVIYAPIAEVAGLQVEAGHAPARALYDRFGLRTELYRYHYRREPAAR